MGRSFLHLPFAAECCSPMLPVLTASVCSTSHLCRSFIHCDLGLSLLSPHPQATQGLSFPTYFLYNAPSRAQCTLPRMDS